MIKKAVFIICVLITMAFSGSALGSTYYGYSDWGGTWHDANKTNNGDSNLCWAAAASNILDWAGYGNAPYTSDTLIFDDFKSHWSNLGGLPAYGWDWYLNGTLPPADQDPTWSKVIFAGGDNNWPLVQFASVYHKEGDDSKAMSKVKSFLQAGYGVTLAVYTSGGAHALTCWGYDYDDAGHYQGVWVTDSDDGIFDKVYYSVSQPVVDGAWYLGDGDGYPGGECNGWYIGEVEALSRNATRVPEPATLLLLGLGLLGLAGLRKKN